MAFSPCAAHGGMYHGGANTFFLRLVTGGDAIGGRLQECANCATVTIEYLRERFAKVSEGETFYPYAEPLACSNCGGELGPDYVSFFGNAYLRGAQETQWYGKVCAECVAPVTEDLHLDKAQVRP